MDDQLIDILNGSVCEALRAVIKSDKTKWNVYGKIGGFECSDQLIDAVLALGDLSK